LQGEVLSLPVNDLTRKLTFEASNKTNQIFSPPAQEGFIGALRHSFAYGLVQAPLQGVAQVIDHTAGQAFHTNFYDRTKDLLIKAPEEARFGSADWYGQTFGGALAVLPWFILTRNGLRAAEGASAVTRGLVVASEEAASAKTFFETAGFKTTLESGLTGAAYSGLFRPTNDSDTNYWQAKTQMMAKDFVTFSALTASSMSIASKLNYYVALPMVQDSAIMKDIAAKGVAITTGILSAGPAAVAGTTVDLITNAGQKPLRFQDFAKDVYSYAVVGAGLSVMPSGGKGKALHHEKDYGPYSNGADWKASVDRFNNHEIDSKALQVADAFSNSLYMRLFAKGKHPYIESVEFGQGFEKTKFAGSMHDINDSNIVSTKDLSETFAHMPNAFTFKKAIGDRYVGTLPEGLDGRFDAERKQILANLDLLAKALRSLDGNLPPQKKYGQGAFDLGLEPFKISLGEKEVEVSKIGTGELSHVYKLKSENKEYAFYPRYWPRVALSSVTTGLPIEDREM